MTDTLFPWIELSERLDRIAGDIALAPHFIDGPNGEWRMDGEFVTIYTDATAAFCRPCGLAVVQLLKAHGCEEGGLKPELQEDSWGESDGSRKCEVCGALLDCSLTDEGAQEEARHYLDHEPSFPLPREDAYCLARVAESEVAGEAFQGVLQDWLERHDAAREESA